MHWGVRKAKDDSPNHRYSQRSRAVDKSTFGKGGAKRINRRMNAGKTHKQAVRREYGVQGFKGLVSAGAVITYGLVKTYGPVAAQHVSQKAETKRGQAATANAMGLPRKAADGPTFAKKSRSGVHNITSL